MSGSAVFRKTLPAQPFDSVENPGISESGLLQQTSSLEAGKESSDNEVRGTSITCFGWFQTVPKIKNEGECEGEGEGEADMDLINTTTFYILPVDC